MRATLLTTRALLTLSRVNCNGRLSSFAPGGLMTHSPPAVDQRRQSPGWMPCHAQARGSATPRDDARYMAIDAQQRTSGIFRAVLRMVVGPPGAQHTARASNAAPHYRPTLLQGSVSATAYAALWMGPISDSIWTQHAPTCRWWQLHTFDKPCSAAMGSDCCAGRSPVQPHRCRQVRPASNSRSTATHPTARRIPSRAA